MRYWLFVIITGNTVQIIKLQVKSIHMVAVIDYEHNIHIQ